MIYSNDRKLCLSGWLQAANQAAYDVPLKLQKFLFLYEAFSKTSGDASDFSHLRGYARGPVFSNVWGDYTKERSTFNREAAEHYMSNSAQLNEERAEKCSFIVRTLTEKELSELTHRMNIWSAKRSRIMGGERQVNLDEQDFNDDDAEMIRTLDAMYPISMIRNSVPVPIDGTCFVLSAEDNTKLTEAHMDALAQLAANEELHNPVYVEIDSEGGLAID